MSSRMHLPEKPSTNSPADQDASPAFPGLVLQLICAFVALNANHRFIRVSPIREYDIFKGSLES